MAKRFDASWNELRAGKPRAAIAALDEALIKFPRHPFAEDTTFWRGVALVRAQRTGKAARALSGFLVRYPRSPRAGEASAMLGWILVEEGTVDAARARLRDSRRRSRAKRSCERAEGPHDDRSLRVEQKK